jgi:hypothetical protein
MNRGRWTLAAALAVTATWSIISVTNDQDEAGIGPVLARTRDAASPASRVANAAGPSFELPTRMPPPRHLRDLFAPYSWVPPPKPVPPPPPPPPPLPKLPYSYAGQLTVGPKASVLLLSATTTAQVAVGERVGDFELQSLSSDVAAFRHLPTGQQVLLPIPRTP